MTLKEFKEKFGNLPDNTQIFGVNANGDSRSSVHFLR